MKNTLPGLTDLILVAVMNKPRDLEIARLLGWYRIPLRTAPKVIAVDYLAFYQTTAFGEERWRIQHLAPVLGYELTTRAELLQDEPDHPHATQEYFKVQLGPLTSLRDPIPAKKWRRITFFYTTGELLAKANDVKDLIVPSEARKLLWQALRERASQQQAYQPAPLPEFDLPPDLLAEFLGIKEAEQIYASQSEFPSTGKD